MKKKIIVALTGAGISAESGIQTFRDSDGLWEGYKIEEVATFDAWLKNPEMVQDFYNMRRKAVLKSEPNAAHIALAQLENFYEVKVVTQNIDNLHERAGSTQVLHLHGEIIKSQSTKKASLVYDIKGWELKMGDNCELGSQLRPYIVWFGEQVPMMEKATQWVAEADYFVVIGTSLVVYPAAGLVNYVKPEVSIAIVDPGNPLVQKQNRITFINQKATTGVQYWIDNHLA